MKQCIRSCSFPDDSGAGIPLVFITSDESHYMPVELEKSNAILVTDYGERSQVVKAVDCDSTIRGFDPRRSPFICR